jgi:cell division transport system ATP-binding protein
MIQFKNVTKKFANGLVALAAVTLNIDKQEFVFITGASGAGKTTLLRLIIRDILPTSGEVIVDGEEVTKLPRKRILDLRRKVGMVFQDFKLLTDRTVFENVALALEIMGKKPQDNTLEVEKILTQVGLINQKDFFPIQLSGGEAQRTVIARAVVAKPKILLADEPTGNLDRSTSWEIIKLLEEINKNGTTVIMATHNFDIVNSLKKRVITLEKGKVKRDEKEGQY